MPKASKDKESVPRAIWNSSCDSILVECLKKQKANGRMTSNSSWHSAAWVEAEKDLAGTEETSGGCKKNAATSQKGVFSGQAGPGQVRFWSLSRVTATDESDPKLAKWRKTVFPLYNDLDKLIVGTVTTGKGAFCPGCDFTSFSEPGNIDDRAGRCSTSSDNDGPGYEEPEAKETFLGPVTPWRADSRGWKCSVNNSFESASSSKHSCAWQSKWLPRSLELLFGGQKETNIDKQLRQTHYCQAFTDEAQLMEDEEMDKERIPDDRELEKSGDDFDG
ncbi:hypothetical protein B0H34DRAFT_670918 [Crassisporium funariophilum]|nr:hypothetical protein B0H34DRAFT_670918 [Crassisporium funariophilum]